MEELGDEKPPVSPKEVKDDVPTADVPAEEVEDGGDEEAITDSDSKSGSDSSSESDSDSEYECKVCEKTFSGYLPFKQHRKGKKHAKAVLKKKKEKKLLKMGESDKSDQEELVEEPYAECKTCKKDFYGPEAYEQHLKCKKHKQRALEASILNQVKIDGKIDEEKLRKLCKKKRPADSGLEEGKEMKTLSLDDEEDEDEEKEFECRDCEKFFSGLIPYTQHLTSKVHAKKLEKKALLNKVVPEKHEKDPTKSKQDVSTLCVEDDVLVCKACSTSFSGPESAMTHMKSKKHAKKLEKYLRKLEKKKQKKDSTQDDLEISKKEKEQIEKEDTDEHYTDSLNGSDVIPSTSSNEGLIQYEKYKEYKKIMNSIPETEAKK